MKIKTWLLLAGLVSLLAACAGEKNDTNSTDESVIFAVRSFEDGNGNTSDDMNEVAIIKGNFETPEQAQAAADSATWVPMSSFTKNDEMDFEAVDMASNTDFGGRDNDWGRDGRDNDRDGRWNDRDGGRDNDRDGRWNDRDGGRDNDRDGRWNDRGRDNDRGCNRGRNRCFEGRGHHWRPFTPAKRYEVRWTTWAQPTYNYYGYSSCGYQYIWYNGGCVRPVSRYYNNYSWQHFYSYNVTVTYRVTRKPRRCRVRFYH